MLNQVDFSKLNQDDYLNLNYWLANALLNTGKYVEAERLIIKTIKNTSDDRFHFLLALTYDSQGEKKKANLELLKLINQFPQSDYKATALIKARMLGRR